MLIQKKLNRDAGKLRLRLKQAFSLLFACLMILQTGVVTAFAAPSASVIRSDELRGVWISYLDWERLPADQESFKHEVDKMLDRCLPSDQGQIQEKLARFTNENGQVSAQALAVFTYVETIQYTNELLYSVLSEALNIQE